MAAPDQRPGREAVPVRAGLLDTAVALLRPVTERAVTLPDVDLD